MDDVIFLNKLKNSILLKTGIRTVTPHDCKLISLKIEEKLNKCISETTIKRLFGFAVSSHRFSTFTLATLAEYVWDDYPTPVVSPATSDNLALDWGNAIKITKKTLCSIKSIQEIPYELTISRKFAEHDFSEFFNSDQTFSAFISQPGYGKTIMLSRLAETIPDSSYHSILLAFDILSLNAIQIKSRIAHLSKFKNIHWVINPLWIAMLVHGKLTGEQQKGGLFFKQLEQYASNQKLSDKEFQPAQAISYTLILLAYPFAGEKDNAHILTKLVAGRQLMRTLRSSPFSRLLMSLFGYICARINPGTKTDQLGNILIMLNERRLFSKLDCYSGAIIKMIQIMKLKTKDNYTVAYDLCMECMDFFKTNKLIINQLMTYNLIIRLFKAMDDHLRVYEYNYERLCFIEEHNIPNGILLQTF